MSLRSCLALVVIATTMACASNVPATQEVSTRGAGPTAIDTLTVARLVHQEVNRVRAGHGLRALAWDARLGTVAAGHSRDMLQRDYFAHDSPEGDGFAQRYARASYVCRVPLTKRSYLTGGENLALTHHNARFIVYDDGRRVPTGFRTPQQVAQRVVVGWMNSPGHRANLLKPQWLRQGIGVVIGADGRIWVTQNFC